MMLQWLSEKIFSSGDDEISQPALVTPQLGATAILIEAAHRDGIYTEVEKDLATGAIMKLLHLGNAEAVALRREAEAAHADAPHMMRFANAARALDADTKEQLITQIWAVLDSDREEEVRESFLIYRVIEVLGISRDRAGALHAPMPKRSD